MVDETCVLIFGILVVSGAYIAYKGNVLFLLKRAFGSKPVSDDFNMNIPIFSDDTDWNLQETQNKLSYALESYGFCYYKMNDIDKKMYKLIYRESLSFFDKTLNNELFIDKLPNLRNFQCKCINYGYLDSFKKMSQCRAFVIPFENIENNENNIDFVNDKNNPFRNNKNIEIYVNSVIKHCSLFLNGLITSYLNKNGFNNDLIPKQEILRLIGNNPQKHLRINYYDPLVLNDKNHENDKYGVKPHSDYGFLTFLKPSTQGLQIYFNNKWFNVPYFEDRFIVNIGKALSKTTNFQFKAAKHTVPLIRNGKKRISLAFFYDPDLNGNLMHYQSNGKLKILKDFKTYFYGDSMKSYKKKIKSSYPN